MPEARALLRRGGRVRERKDSLARRAPRRRAEGRALLRWLVAFQEIAHHRGGRLTRCGRALAEALEGAARGVREA